MLARCRAYKWWGRAEARLGWDAFVWVTHSDLNLTHFNDSKVIDISSSKLTWQYLWRVCVCWMRYITPPAQTKIRWILIFNFQVQLVATKAMVSNHFSGNIDLRRLPLILIQSHIKSDHYVSARLHDVQLITVQMNDPLLCKWYECKDLRGSLGHFPYFGSSWGAALLQMKSGCSWFLDLLVHYKPLGLSGFISQGILAIVVVKNTHTFVCR